MKQGLFQPILAIIPLQMLWFFIVEIAQKTQKQFDSIVTRPNFLANHPS